MNKISTTWEKTKQFVVEIYNLDQIKNEFSWRTFDYSKIHDNFITWDGIKNQKSENL